MEYRTGALVARAYDPLGARETTPTRGDGYGAVLGVTDEAAGTAENQQGATMTYRNRKVGGIRFIRLGRMQVSFCRCKAEPADRMALSEGAADAVVALVVAAVTVPFLGELVTLGRLAALVALSVR
jgi:hypothetical protein